MGYSKSFLHRFAHIHNRESSESEESEPIRRNSFVKALLIIELLHIVLFLALYATSQILQQSTIPRYELNSSDGVVAVDTQWALQHGYAPTFIHPYDESKSIYQIDMFHSMHCIHRIRNKLTSELSLQEWPRNDEHTLHCLDYLREQLMCNADLTLEGTDDLLHFNKTSGHVCRNYNAIMEWAKAHHWAGHRAFVTKSTGYE
ncbi:hypothetical protein VTL71DRAFT_13161 [Oculimacula yallundae]|uniref:Uncharacterized protein n=1 Tax=Oculimacula yallundae TaxID=86028 RepID=A0ABR4CRU6_9HELO